MTEPPASIPRYPLEWPTGWARTRARRHAEFTMTHEEGRDPVTGLAAKRVVAVNMVTAIARLEKQLQRLGATNTTLSTNVTLTLSGRPRGDEKPSDPGAAVYFAFRGKATVLACDTYYRVADNIAALAAHIDALRRIERYGVGTIEQALAGYKALPADSAADWRMVLFGTKDVRVSREDVQAAYRARAREVHPDVRGDDGAAMAHLNRARDYAFAELDGGAPA